MMQALFDACKEGAAQTEGPLLDGLDINCAESRGIVIDCFLLVQKFIITLIIIIINIIIILYLFISLLILFIYYYYYIIIVIC